MKLIALFLPHLGVSGGLGVHCRMLVAALARTPSPHRFIVYSPAKPRDLFPTTESEPLELAGSDWSRFQFRDLEIPRGFNLANELDPILAGPLAIAKPDLLYCSYYTGMRSPPCPQIVAFHDAGFLENPEGFGATAAIRRQTIDAIRPAISLIQCISGDARERICRLLPWDAKNMAVVWHALPDSPEAIAAASAVDANTIAIGESNLEKMRPYFFLPVGAATGFNRLRKNVATAVRAFRQLPPGSQLIIAGTAQLTEKVLAELLPPGERGSVIDGLWFSEDRTMVILPTLSRGDFLTAMHRAAAVVYPSRYEGFGLPTVEAMAAGVPLIAAKATSVTEVVGDAGILIEPDDVDGFTAAMQAALTDRERMAKLISAGRERAKLFYLERLGREMIELFEG